MLSREYSKVAKITCFEKYLRTAASIRFYFDKGNLKQYRNNLKNGEFQIITIIIMIIIIVITL